MKEIIPRVFASGSDSSQSQREIHLNQDSVDGHTNITGTRVKWMNRTSVASDLLWTDRAGWILDPSEPPVLLLLFHLKVNVY